MTARPSKDTNDGRKSVGKACSLSSASANPSLGYWASKRFFDITLSVLGIIILSPIFLTTAIAVKTTSPGPVIFRQPRYGKDKKPFYCLKFRSMTIETPNNIPSREMRDHKSCLTPVGGFIRRNSLDELPQMFNILVGDMAIVGPRPVIIQEGSQIELRDEYGANDIRPGLTGWAQVNGRDAIGIEEKARFDGEYRQNMSFLFDIKCFFRSVGVIFSGGEFGDAIKIKEIEALGENPSELFVEEHQGLPSEKEAEILEELAAEMV